MSIAFLTAALPSFQRATHITRLARRDRERADLLEFFDNLTDEALLGDPRFENPGQWAVGSGQRG